MPEWMGWLFQGVGWSVVLFLLPYIVAFVRALNDSLMRTSAQYQHVMTCDLVQTVVAYEEQVFKNQQGTGALKKRDAMDLTSTLLRQRGLPVSADMLEALIEAAVAGLPKTQPPAPAEAA